MVAHSIDSDDGFLNEIMHRGKWKYKSCMSVDFILRSYGRSSGEWHDFLEDEIQCAASYLGNATYYDDLWESWSREPSTSPITIIVQSFSPLVLDTVHGYGVPLFDGNHRFALALEHGWTYVPCFLGKPK
jgi:hypothetical protein